MPPAAAAVYARISLDRDATALGVKRQKEDCLALAAHLGWQVAEVYTDNSVSASKGVARPEFNRMMTHLREKSRDGLIVYDLDRLTRRLSELAAFMDDQQKYGFELANVAGDVDLTTANGRMIAGIKGSVAQQEAERIGERVARAARQRAEAGAPQKSRFRCFGYDKEFNIIPEEAALLRDAYARYIAGESITSIMQTFMNSGIPTVNGGRWYRSTLVKVLNREANAGIRMYRGQEVRAGAWEAIIDRPTFDAAKAKLNSTTKAMPDTTSKHLLSNIARCGECGFALSGNNKGKYQCVKSNGGCGRVVRSMKHLDTFVNRVMVEYFETRPEVGTTLKEDTITPKIDALQAKVKETQEGYSKDLLDFADFQPVVSSLRAQIAALRTEQAQGATKSSDVTTAFRWDTANRMQKRAMMRAVLDSIKVEKSTAPNGTRGFDPTKVKFIWK